MTCHAAVRGRVTRRCPSPSTGVIDHAVERLRSAWRARRERQWTALVAIPLALTATGLLNMWWAWPLLLLGAWACTPSWRWLWLLSLELGFVGVMWATLGATALARLPSYRLLVGGLWAAFPLALAGATTINRRRHAGDAHRSAR